MDELMKHHNVDIQWGNHDIVWMAAAAGSASCIANVIRVCLRYSNMETLENGYAISMLPLASFAMDVYGDDPCEQFRPKAPPGEEYTDNELALLSKMHKAISIIQLKLEEQIISRRPHYEMQNRLLLDKIDFDHGTITIGDKAYDLIDTRFPTIDPANPRALSEREEHLVERLRIAFANSERLQQHVRFLYAKGSMYLVHNGNLLYHGCISMNEDGTFSDFIVDGVSYQARSFMDRVERLARQGYFSSDPERKQYGLDAMWYLWCGPQSPIFGKDKMATFERYFIAEPETHIELKNPYYVLRDKEETARHILEAFGLDPDRGHIINGHVPVKVRRGESPIKSGGKLLVIDGGFAKAYQAQTGIAGYTLIYNSYGLLLASHDPFESTQLAIEDEIDIDTDTQILETNFNRIRVKDTDRGRRIQQQISELKQLVEAYRTGLIKENA
jgi:fructose-1,6-bisphosphatase-3